MESFEQQAKLFRTLMHPARLAILEVLRGGEQCVCHMEAFLGLRQAYSSQQLMILREAGLVQDRRDGWNIFYRVTQPAVYDILDATNVLVGAPPMSSANAIRTESGHSKCECPKCKEAEQMKIRN